MIETLQSLRIVFSLTVMLAHFSYAGIEGHSTGVGPMFFMLMTGFVMSKSYGIKVLDGTFKYGQYLLCRLFKFYPLHLLCLLLVVVIRRNTMVTEDYESLIPNILMLQSWIPKQSFYFSGNAVSWYLSDLMFFLLLFPFLYKRIGKMEGRGLLRLVVCLLLVYVIYVTFLQVDDLNYWLYVFPPIRLFDFMWGMVMYRCYELYPTVGGASSTWKEILLIVGVVLTIVFYPLHDKWHVALIHWLVLVPVVWIFMQGDKRGGFISRFLKTRTMVWLGGLTLETYLLHQIIFSIILHNAEKYHVQLPYMLMLVLCLGVAILLSWLTHICFVNPINRKLRLLIIEKK
ncbi:MAG: acyltransferase [Prevotella sp.]|nr:acyltransferase [Prevotella sp.]